MSRFQDLIQRGTRAAQPAAAAVPVGTLYCVTDEDNLVERSTGAAWESYSYSDPTPNFTSISLGGQKLQGFTWQIQNDAGTLKHAFFGNSLGTADASSYIDKITGASTTPTATPTVGAGVDFTNGAGITTNNAVFNTAAQVAASFFGHAEIVYYSGNNTRCHAIAGFVSRNVNGTTRVRLECGLFNDMTGGSVNFNTTLLPSGTQMQIRFSVFLA